MIEELRTKMLEGPLEHPLYGKALVITPTVATHKAHRFPSQAFVITTAAKRLIELSKGGEKLKAIIVSGTEDPTLHPEFSEITDNLRELVNKWFPKASLCLRSQQPDLERADVRHALGVYDQPTVMLEAGTQKTYTALTGGKPTAFKAKIEGMERVETERLIVETTFVRGSVDNTNETELRSWIRQIKGIRPGTVRIQTPARQSQGRRPVSKSRMTQIAEAVTEKTGIPVEVGAE